MKAKIRECAFCGDREQSTLELTPTAWEIHCGNGDCTVSPTAYGSTEEEVIAKWNTRFIALDAPIMAALSLVIRDAMLTTDNGAYIGPRDNRSPVTDWYRVDGEFDFSYVAARVLAALGPTEQARTEAWAKIMNPPMMMTGQILDIDKNGMFITKEKDE